MIIHVCVNNEVFAKFLFFVLCLVSSVFLISLTYSYVSVYHTPMMANGGKCNVKISGYLEKKGKMKMMSSWKSHWFVLEGRLLLYYRSKDEYESLSPCKGSINLGPSCSVKPLLGTSCVFQIETRVNTVILKAKTRLEQEKWMQALLSALNHTSNTNGMLHFRYSSDELIPRRPTTTKSALSKQFTLPKRLKVEKRHTFCRSFETLQQDSEQLSKNSKIKSTSDVLNTELNKNCKSVEISTENDVYYAISQPTEEEREFIRKRDQEKAEHIYERISGESRISNTSKEVFIDNDTYVTTSDIRNLSTKNTDSDDISIDNDIYDRKARKEDSSDEMLVDNDQYCTPDMIVRDTKLATYCEFNVPDKDKHIYSLPNFDDTDYNENRVLQKSDQDVNPYSVCHIYPKSQNTSNLFNSQDDDVIYDSPVDYVEISEGGQEGNVTKLLRKFKKVTGANEIEKKNSTTKKTSFLQKLFKRKHHEKRKPKPIVEEMEYAQIDEEAVKKMDMAYCIDKKLLAELQMILQIKKKNLEEYLEENKISNKYEDEYKDNSKSKQQASDKINRPEVPRKPQKNKGILKYNTNHHGGYENLKTIDEILNDLEEMKLNKSLSSGNVKHLIDKFEKSVKERDVTLTSSNELLYDVVLRPKDKIEGSASSMHNSDDELNRLLCELAKVTSAPLLTPGTTSSLSVTCTTRDQEFVDLLPRNKRRYSEPDYDVPRPHSNLQIFKYNENCNDKLQATRFFGPAMPNYDEHGESSLPLASITPDSLEVDISPVSIDISMPSYSSHKYDTIGKSTKFQRQISKEEDMCIDSLEPHDISIIS